MFKNNQASKADVKVMVQTVRYLITSLSFSSFTFTHYREIPTEGDKALCKYEAVAQSNASMLAYLLHTALYFLKNSIWNCVLCNIVNRFGVIRTIFKYINAINVSFIIVVC